MSGDTVWDDDEVLGMGAQPRERTCSLPLNCRRGVRDAVCTMWTWPQSTKNKDKHHTGSVPPSSEPPPHPHPATTQQDAALRSRHVTSLEQLLLNARSSS